MKNTTTTPSATFLKVTPTQEQLNDIQCQLKQINEEFDVDVGDFTNKYLVEEYFYELVDDEVSMRIGNGYLMGPHGSLTMAIGAKNRRALFINTELTHEQISKLDSDLRIYFEDNEIEIKP